MVVVQSVDVRNTDILHRLLLNEAYPLLPLLDGSGTGARSIQDGANLVFRDARVEHGLVEFPVARGIIPAHDVEIQLQHLADFLVQRHLGQRLLNLGL